MHITREFICYTGQTTKLVTKLHTGKLYTAGGIIQIAKVTMSVQYTTAYSILQVAPRVDLVSCRMETINGIKSNLESKLHSS